MAGAQGSQRRHCCRQHSSAKRLPPDLHRRKDLPSKPARVALHDWQVAEAGNRLHQPQNIRHPMGQPAGDDTFAEEGNLADAQQARCEGRLDYKIGQVRRPYQSGWQKKNISDYSTRLRKPAWLTPEQPKTFSGNSRERGDSLKGSFSKRCIGLPAAGYSIAKKSPIALPKVCIYCTGPTA
jgi:hypothetical protein